MSRNSSSAPSFAAPKIVERGDVPGVKPGSSLMLTTLVFLQIVIFIRNGTTISGRITARRITGKALTPTRVRAMSPNMKVEKRLLGLYHCTYCYLLLILRSAGLNQNRACNPAGRR